MSSTTTPIPPPLDCSLVLCDLINFHMQHNPTLPMLVYADGQDTTEINFLEFGRAAHRIARALRPSREGDDGQVVMIIANCDTLLHQAILVGMSVAGIIPFPVSPRNSAAAVVHMMEKTNCSRIVTLHDAHQSLIDDVRALVSGRELTVDEIPTLSYTFPKLGREVETHQFAPYPPPASRPDLNATSLYIHSSGSTGFPKPIPHSHKVQIHLMTQPILDYFHRMSARERIAVMALPPFHNYAVMMQIYLPIATFVSAVIYPPQALTDMQVAPVMPTPDNVLDSIRQTNCKVLMTVPTFLEQWAASEEAVETLKSLDLVMYGGGPLAQKIGDELYAAGVMITGGYGGTEFGGPTSLPNRKDVQDGDWSWLRFSDRVKIKWVLNDDDTFECQVLTTENNQMAVENLPDVKGYATSDLFIKHPTKNLWKIVGRVDDVITLASGEKTVPAPMESIINSSPLVRGAVMFGRERNQVGILVEPRAEHVGIRDDSAVAVFRNKIWPLVEEANKIAPAFSRIFKEMILIVDPEQPMVRTPKGTVQRKATIMAYTTKIDALYEMVEATYRPSEGQAGPSIWNAKTIQDWLTEHACAISQGNNIDPSTDVFAQGFDSLSVTYLRNRLSSALRSSPDSKIRDAASRISPNIIFENPTLELLAARIADLVDGCEASQGLDSRQERARGMEAMIEKYSVGLSGPAALINGTTHVEISTDRAVVLLTGSTGGLGSFLLSQLIENPAVERVYALNRPSSTPIKERQRSAFVDRGLSVAPLASAKLVYLEADTSQDNCGVSPDLYKEIRDSVTIVIHNAWRLDFNLSLVSFEPNIKATQNLVNLALESRHRRSLRFVFTSSVGIAQSWDRAQGPFPEEIQSDPSFAVGTGYTESKYVSERIIAKSGLSATSLRIGQIAGGPNGAWATTDWVPIIVKSSIALGALPDSRGVVSWMRADDVAASVLDVAFAKDVPEALNIVNPQRPSWTNVMSSVRDAILVHTSLGSDHLTMVPFVDWVTRLEKKAEDASPDDLDRIPAIKLVEYFRAMAHHDELAQKEGYLGETGGITDFSTAKSQQVSKTLAHMRPVGEPETRSWVEYWTTKGFF